MTKFEQICNDTFYRMENYHQVSIDLIQEAEELLNSDSFDRKRDQVESLGALSYTISTVLEVFNSIYKDEISGLEYVLVHIENKIKEFNDLTIAE